MTALKGMDYCEQRLPFLWFSYFGIPCKKGDEIDEAYKQNALNACIKRAYRDVNRKLEFNVLKDGDERFDKLKNIKKRFSPAYGKESCETVPLICGHIVDLLKHQYDCCGEFDIWHRRTCNCLVSYVRELEKEAPLFGKYRYSGDLRGKEIQFTYGHAQKWINMTLKYMLVMGLWDDELENTAQFFHVPIDSIIMSRSDRLGIERSFAYWYAIDDYNSYMQYQKDIREKLNIAPIVWEAEAWIGESE